LDSGCKGKNQNLMLSKRPGWQGTDSKKRKPEKKKITFALKTFRNIFTVSD
jgi:hypothetical protein